MPLEQHHKIGKKKTLLLPIIFHSIKSYQNKILQSCEPIPSFIKGDTVGTQFFFNSLCGYTNWAETREYMAKLGRASRQGDFEDNGAFTPDV